MSTTKYRKIIFLLLAIWAVIILSACQKPARLPVLAKSDVVVAFGDSITFGIGAEPQESYPAVLEQMIGRRVVNAGISGEVTAEGLSRLPQILESEKPVLLILGHGGNDHLRRLNRGQAADNIREMIRLARQRGTAVVLIAVPGFSLSFLRNRCIRTLPKNLKFHWKKKHYPIFLPIIP